MKTISKFLILSLVILGMASCNNDDDNTPDPVNEEEVITTMTITLTPEGGGTPVVLQSRDLDGDGPDPQVITPVTVELVVGVTYNGTIVLLNETETPAENITEEVEEEDDEHQFFYIPSSGLDVTFDYGNFDGDGNPLGTEFTLVANTASTGTVNFVLRHEPNKPNDGTLGDAGGETDISVTWDVEAQ